MKKIIFLFAMVLVVSFITAQNTATTTQTGDLNLVNIDQQGGATAVVNQTSNRTTAHDNSVNEVGVNQSGASTASVTQVQTGSGDFGGLYAEGNQAYVIQVGAGHSATIDQEGRNEEYGADWNGYPDYGKGAYISQTGGDNSTATIIQKGAANDGDIIQVGNNHDAFSKLLMSGSNLNTTYISQTGGDGNRAYQLGDAVGSFKKNYFSIIQTAGGNLADQLMQGNLGNWAGGNSQTIVQHGEGNNADQDLINPVSTVIGNSQTILQYTGSNNAEQVISDNTDWHYHNGAYNTQIISQDGGTVNFARQEQMDIDNGYSYISQTGNSNIAFTKQNGVDATGSSSVIVQDGDSNEARLDQKGGTSDILQDGNSNKVMGLDTDLFGISYGNSTLDVDQISDGNTLHLQQTNGASATVMQDGMTNTAVVIQN